MDRVTAFDLVIVLGLLAMFILGYAQGLIRRLLGTAALIFSLILAAQLRPPLGNYLAEQWQGISAEYSHMVAFGAVFLAAAITLSIAIQITYRPAPLLTRYPVLDEILGGIVGVFQGLVLLVFVFLMLDPYYTSPEVRETIGRGEFTLLRTIHELLDPTLTAEIMRTTIIPAILSVFGFLFPQDMVEEFLGSAAVAVAVARR